jgi:hypothetical protein
VALKSLGSLVLASLVASGCNRPTPPAAAAEEELEPLSVTRWTDKTELFAEYPPLVAGETSRFAIHLTWLDTFKPVTDGHVEVLVRDGASPPEVFRVDAPSRPGIFGVDVIPAHAGVRQLVIHVRLALKDRSRDVVLEELREKMSLLPGTNVTVGQPISHRIDHMLSGTRANIAVKILGDELPMLRLLASQVQAEMAQVAGVVDLSTEAQTDIPTLRVRVDPGAAAHQGLETGAVAETLQTARVGHTVGQVLEG